jgi:uncharacterized membrane protein
LVVVAALAAANLPFVNESLFGFIPWHPRRGAAQAGGVRKKLFAVRLLELLVLYFIVGALGYALESGIGNVFSQTWEFYAITGPMFVVLAFPGFVLRYLRKRRG